MASNDDNFDIDIYGDGVEDTNVETDQMETQDITTEEAVKDEHPPHKVAPVNASSPSNQKAQVGPAANDIAQKIASTDASASDPVALPKQAPQAQGISHENGSEDKRPVDPGASTALLVSDLHWWINDDDVRGWANQCRCEDELEEVTFSEHKVNGKSKGQVLSQISHDHSDAI